MVSCDSCGNKCPSCGKPVGNSCAICGSRDFSKSIPYSEWKPKPALAKACETCGNPKRGWVCSKICRDHSEWQPISTITNKDCETCENKIKSNDCGDGCSLPICPKPAPASTVLTDKEINKVAPGIVVDNHKLMNLLRAQNAHTRLERGKEITKELKHILTRTPLSDTRELCNNIAVLIKRLEEEK